MPIRSLPAPRRFARAPALFAALLLALTPAGAQAAILFNFTFTQTLVAVGPGTGNITGTFVVNDTLDTIIGISGSTGTQGAIGALFPVGGFEDNDNAFSPDLPFVSPAFGVSFGTDGVALNIGAFRSVTGDWNWSANDGGLAVASVFSFGTLSVVRAEVAVPAPAALGLFGLGLLALGALRRRGTV
jgi:hypothetical protein